VACNVRARAAPCIPFATNGLVTAGAKTAGGFCGRIAGAGVEAAKTLLVHEKPPVDTLRKSGI
jgi:hypothetical protein